MEICKTCKMTPICTYAGDDYDLPEIFEVNCKFYEAVQNEAENTQNDTENAQEDPQPEEPDGAPISEPEKVQEAIDDMIDELDGSESKYPAKKKKRMTAALKKKAADMYHDGAYISQIAEELGISESEVTKALKESLGVK